MSLPEFVLLKIAAVSEQSAANYKEISYHVREISARDHADDFVVLIDHDEMPQSHGAEQLKDT